jgi:hypothetical protein
MKTETALTPNDLAREIVGDGKKPNKYFLTIGYGYYKPKDSEELIQVENSIEAVTILLPNKEAAMAAFEAIEMIPNSKVTGETIGQVMIEDRLRGTVIEKILTQRQNGSFYIDTWR